MLTGRGDRKSLDRIWRVELSKALTAHVDRGWAALQDRSVQVIAPLVDRAPEANTVQQFLLLRVRFLLCNDLVLFLELVEIYP